MSEQWLQPLNAQSFRCWWPGDDAPYQHYHDTEWGRPVRNDQKLFEKLCLEGFQAGLSWLTILRKRENFRKAFSNFHIDVVASYSEKHVNALMQDVGIVRHRGKIEAVINNARVMLEKNLSLEELISKHSPTVDRRGLTVSPESTALSKELRKLGFNFVGPTTMHAMMQAIGVINDHDENCFISGR